MGIQSHFKCGVIAIILAMVLLTDVVVSYGDFPTEQYCEVFCGGNTGGPYPPITLPVVDGYRRTRWRSLSGRDCTGRFGQSCWGSHGRKRKR